MAMVPSESLSQLQTSTPRRITRIEFNPRQRWACTGKTGEGKTVYERWWLAHWYAGRWPIVIIDIKRKFAQRYAEQPEYATIDRPYSIDGSAQLLPNCPVMVYHPSLPGWKDERLNRLFLQILAAGHVVLALDEVAGVADETHCPLGLQLIYMQGRESDIPTLACFQKPVRIPIDLMEQSEWWVVFRVNFDEYRKRIVQMTGFPELIMRPPRHHYWLANESWEHPVLMAPVPMEEFASGAENLGTPSRRLLDQTNQGGGQSGRQIAQPGQLGQTRVREVRGHADASHTHSRIHARSSRRAG